MSIDFNTEKIPMEAIQALKIIEELLDSILISWCIFIRFCLKLQS